MRTSHKTVPTGFPNAFADLRLPMHAIAFDDILGEESRLCELVVV
jgi:hypothetical protein